MWSCITNMIFCRFSSVTTLDVIIFLLKPYLLGRKYSILDFIDLLFS